eukprot:gene25740-19470_t
MWRGAAVLTAVGTGAQTDGASTPALADLPLLHTDPDNNKGKRQAATPSPFPLPTVGKQTDTDLGDCPADDPGWAQCRDLQLSCGEVRAPG